MPPSSGVDQDVPEHEWHVPVDQMLYVGDGASDLPAFDLVERHGGLGVGVLHAERNEDWKAAQRMRPRARVENLASADCAEGAPMRQILTLEVEILAKRVALRRLALPIDRRAGTRTAVALPAGRSLLLSVERAFGVQPKPVPPSGDRDARAGGRARADRRC